MRSRPISRYPKDSFRIHSSTFCPPVGISPVLVKIQCPFDRFLLFFFFCSFPSFPVEMETKFWVGTARHRFCLWSQYQTIKCTFYREETRASRMRKFSSYSKYVLVTKIERAFVLFFCHFIFSFFVFFSIFSLFFLIDCLNQRRGGTNTNV